MLRTVFAVIAGCAIWTTLWLVGNVVIARIWPGVADPGEGPLPTGALHAALGLSVLCSSAAGFATAKGRPGKPVLIVGVLLLATGIAVQASMWDDMPLWYHLIFLVAILPLCLVGGRLAGKPTTA